MSQLLTNLTQTSGLLLAVELTPKPPIITAAAQTLKYFLLFLGETKMLFHVNPLLLHKQIFTPFINNGLLLKERICSSGANSFF